MIQSARTLPVFESPKQIDRFQARLRRDRGRAPEILDNAPVLRVLDLHMRREHVGEAADFTSAHRVRLAGYGERSRARLADPASRQMAVDDRIDLVGPRRRLVDTLAVDSDHASRPGEEVVERGKIAGGELRRGGCRFKAESARLGKRRVEPDRMGADVVLIHAACLGKMREQSGEQRDVRAGREAQMQVGGVGRRGRARIDGDDLRSALLPRRHEPLVKDGVAPGEIGADEHNEIGELEILVQARHGVRAERPSVAGDRRSHAEARIGVDVGRADESFHQLVGDIIVLDQQLARDIEGDAVGSMRCDRLQKALRDEVERSLPAALGAPDDRTEQPIVERERLSERRAFGAEAAEIRGMVRVALDVRSEPAVARTGENAAADPAIGAGGPRPVAAHRAASSRTVELPSAARSISTRPPSTRSGRLSARPLSAPCASPVSRLTTQLCSGQVTLVPCTMP